MRIPTATLLSLSPALLLLPAVAGCAAYRPDLTCPKQGGPSWTEVASPHFVVQTDLPEKRSREIVAELELSRAALTSVLPVDVPGSLSVRTSPIGMDLS